MTDKELLELAAKAAGYIVKDAGWTDEFLCRMVDVYNDEGEQCHQRWNPLTDDGDALRLAVKLRLLIRTPHHDIGDYSTRPLVCSQDRKKDVSCNEGEEVIDDPYAATRRAIVRAAAEIGKAL